MELSGLAGLNTGEVCRSKPVLGKAEDRAKGTGLSKQHRKLCGRSSGDGTPATESEPC